MSLEYNKALIPRAKEMRKEMTPQEQHLWYGYLRRYPVRFQRQKAIYQYIADFYCARAGLVIEVDGAQHFSENALEYDHVRTLTLENMTLSVLRFTNPEVDHAFAKVCRTIDQAVQQRLGSRQNPPQ